MSTLKRNLIQVKQLEVQVVPVPEFGTDDEGNDYTVNVRPLTVQTQGIFTQQLLKRPGGDASAILAAIHAVDDDGKLVFGESIDDAIETIFNLPNGYRTAVLRISSTVLGDYIKDNADDLVTDAEKN